MQVFWPNCEHAHHIDLGLGVEVDDLPFTLNSGTLLLNGHLHVPLLRVKNKETSGGAYVVTNDLPEIETERLIWDPNGAYLSRIALSANLSPETGRFGAQSSFCSVSIALNCAFGQPHHQDNTSIVAKIALLDFIAQQNGIPSTLEIDIVDAVNGGMAGVLENLVPAMMEMLPDDAQSFAENLLPMLGLLDSDWSATGGSAMTWPRLAIIDLIDELQNDSDQAWNRVRSWLLELTHPEVATQWLTHLYALIFPTAPPPWACWRKLHTSRSCLLSNSLICQECRIAHRLVGGCGWRQNARCRREVQLGQVPRKRHRRWKVD